MMCRTVLFEHLITWVIHIGCRLSRRETSYPSIASRFVVSYKALAAMLPVYVAAVVVGAAVVDVAMLAAEAELQSVAAAQRFAAVVEAALYSD